ncbi:hypothetical protein ACFWPK_19055 [Nocardia sp. NPDC058519]|uniref:hypothetical protein n=1 Tax=Nocardia sp. NPDC058519 TaxID=3346535 RepID=UPI00366A06B6
MNRAQETLGPVSPYDYQGVSPQGWTARIQSFDPAVSPTPMRIEFGDGSGLDLVLHTVDGLRQTPRQPGITGQPRFFDGTIEVPRELLAALDTQPTSVGDFVRNTLGGNRFTDTSVDVTDTRFHLSLSDLTLNRH